MINARVQAGVFDPAAESQTLTAGRHDLGAVVSFTGLVRADDGLTALTLEHYPAMTASAMQRVADAAARRWPGVVGTIVHRHGRLLPGDPIVLVVTAAAHRGEAFDAAAFLMDWLKTGAPFWKREERADGHRWVAARASDDAAAARWQPAPPADG